MDKTLAQELLRNLLERAQATTDKTFLTKAEVAALAELLGVGSPVSLANIEATARQEMTPDADVSPQPIKISPLSVSPDEIPAGLTVCVDFGTSFSKAFASIGDGDDVELIDLPIGDGSTGTTLTSPSEMFIEGGRFHFGVHARRRMDQVEADHRLLIDSIKQFITLSEDVTSLALKPMGERDPTKSFSRRDILVLYLAHLMTLTETALKARGLSANARRRFTHPAWKPNVKVSNEREMHRMMAEAIVVSRAAGESLSTSLATDQARSMLDTVKTFTDDLLPMTLVFEPVREATAAGAGALLQTREGRRENYLIIDIGAGTTDVAGFICVNNPERERPVVSEITGAEGAKQMAGNNVDQMLQKFILDRSSLTPDSVEHRAATLAIAKARRQLKETLFRAGEVTFRLPTDELVTVELSAFSKTEGMQRFNKEIRDLVSAAAAATAGDAPRVNFVATGGGATLPIVLELSNSTIQYEGKTIRLVALDPISDDIKRSHPDLVQPYSQIAVALGGALPTLPKPVSNVKTGLTSAPSYVSTPGYKS